MYVTIGILLVIVGAVLIWFHIPYSPIKKSFFNDIEAPPKEIINQPELQVYVEDFGNRTGDICFVAEADKSVVNLGFRSLMRTKRNISWFVS